MKLITLNNNFNKYQLKCSPLPYIQRIGKMRGNIAGEILEEVEVAAAIVDAPRRLFFSTISRVDVDEDR